MDREDSHEPQDKPQDNAEAPSPPQLIEETGSDGQPLMRCQMRDGKLHGLMEQFTDSGTPTLRAQYENGVLHGKMSTYADDGSLVQESDYVQGVAQGTMKTYVNGRCVSVQAMVAGVPSGPSLSYDEAGHLTARLNYVKGQIHGPAEFFHEGVRVRKSNYKEGLLEGESVDFDKQGTIVQTCVYRANVLHGPMRRFWPTGELMEEVVYRNGKPVAPLDRLKYAIGNLLVYGPLRNNLGMSRVRVAYTAGEAIGPDLFTFYRAIGINLKQLYGSTETAVFVCMQPDHEVHADTVGIPCRDVEIKLA